MYVFDFWHKSVWLYPCKISHKIEAMSSMTILRMGWEKEIKLLNKVNKNTESLEVKDLLISNLEKFGF
jgi:hypothetical protein